MRNTGFTLIEIMIGILIVSIIILGGFSALSAVTVGKVRLIEKTNIEKEAFYFSQKLFEMIKSGGTLDYEEYWNRKIVDNTSFSGGHFSEITGFGNFGESGTPGTNIYGNSLYYCLSGSGTHMGTGGCVENNNTNSGSTIIEIDYLSTFEPQRYGQYALQFINFNINADRDYNSTLNANLPGDEDSDGNIIGDDDDEYLGEGPEVFTSGSGTTELYLISGDKKKRTLFRWNVVPDPNRPTGFSCNSPDGGQSFTGSGCLGTIQFLQLEGKDWGTNHNITNNPNNGSIYDGVIDTWLIAPKFHTSGSDLIAASDTNNYWQDLFPDTINVSDFEIYAYPNKDRSLAWKEDQNNVNIAPYIRMTLKLQPSWKKRKLIQGSVPEIDLSTTISLTDLYSQ